MKILAGLLLAALSLPGEKRESCQAGFSLDRPNILLFLSDDHRHDVLGCAGHPILKTPSLDRLAAEGVRFRNMFVTTSICAASRASILTGMYERRHGFTFKTPPLKAEHCAESYPALLKAAGYRTGFFGKFGVKVPKGTEADLFDVFADLNRTPYFKKQPDGSLRHVDDIVGDRAIDFLNAQPKDRPFCLSVSFSAGHAEDGDKANLYPWAPAADGLYEGVEIPRPKHDDPAVFDAHPDFLKRSMCRDRWFWSCDTPEKYQKNMRAYLRLLSGMDAVVGRVLSELDRLGLAKNTVVVFTGDNGYFMGNRGFTGKWIHYEESLRVPLIVRDPRHPGGRVEDRMVLNVDLAPTFVALAGLPVPSGHQGSSLLPLIRGGTSVEWRSDSFFEHLMVEKTIPKWEGVRDGRWKYARYFEQEPPYEFLHDLQADPDELRNLVPSPEHAETLGRLRARTDELKKALGPVAR